MSENTVNNAEAPGQERTADEAANISPVVSGTAPLSEPWDPSIFFQVRAGSWN